MPDRPTSLNDRDPIDIVDSIQPHGAMLVTRLDDWLITHASANLDAFLGHAAHAVLGQPLRDAIGDEACAALRPIEPSTGAGPNAVQLSITGKAGRSLHLRAHRLGRQVCIDIEPADRNTGTKSPLLLTQPVLDSFKNATSSAELCDLAVRGLQAITGYHRVMVCLFSDDGNGEVVAESCAPPMQPCLGLRFPASFIPPQAKQQFLRQRLGMVPDADSTPVPMLASGKPDECLPIDMTYSQLRSVPPRNRDYLRRLQAAASLTIGLADGENLWGLLACHHAAPRIAGTELRAAANVIGQVVSLLHGSLRQADLSTLRLRRNTMLRTLVDRLASSPTLPAALDAVQTELLQLIDAAGFIVRLSGSLLAFGRTPEPSVVEKIVALLQTDADGEILAVDDMECRYPDIGLPKLCCSGALIAPLSYGADDAILWLRSENRKTVRWGVDPPYPHGSIIAPETPYREHQGLAQHPSHPWSDADIALAAEVARRVEAEIVRRTKADLARAQDASRAKSRFLAGMTHELRTPLHGILGYAQLLNTEGGLNELQAMRVHAMMGASTHLLEMINRVLELSEIEAEQVKLCPAALDVQSVIAACLDVVRPNADAKKLALNVSVAPGIATGIIADPMRLRQVLLNLLGNAVKFTGSGAIDVRLAQSDTAAAIRIEVADTGPGIPAAQRTRLFQDFERLQNESVADVEGAGLGLALSARLAALMGGCIGYEPGQTGGSVFWLELPYGTPASGEASEAAEPPAPAETPPAAPLHVLVVDDVAINRGIAESFLRAAGHDVTAANDGAQALHILEREDFDVVLMDVRMPGMDGLEATRRIRAFGGARGQVPVIALTAQAFADQVEECQRAGMQDHLAKPFSPTMLAAAVARAAQRRAAATAPGPRRRAAASDKAPMPDFQPPDLPLIDHRIYQETASYLSAEAVVKYLQTILGQGTNVLAGLRARESTASHLRALADLAHTLAGSAGMFGFARVADLGRQFERSVLMSATDAPALAASLECAIDATLREIADRLETLISATQA